MYTSQQPEYHKSGCSDHSPPLRLSLPQLHWEEGGGWCLEWRGTLFSKAVENGGTVFLMGNGDAIFTFAFFLFTKTILIIDSNTFLTNLISPQDLLLQQFWNLCWILYNRITSFNCGKISNPGKFSFLHVTFFPILNYQANYTTPKALGLILPWD